MGKVTKKMLLTTQLIILAMGSKNIFTHNLLLVSPNLQIDIIDCLPFTDSMFPSPKQYKKLFKYPLANFVYYSLTLHKVNR